MALNSLFNLFLIFSSQYNPKRGIFLIVKSMSSFKIHRNITEKERKFSGKSEPALDLNID